MKAFHLETFLPQNPQVTNDSLPLVFVWAYFLLYGAVLIGKKSPYFKWFLDFIKIKINGRV